MVQDTASSGATLLSGRATASRKYTIFLLTCRWPIRPEEILTSDSYLEPKGIAIEGLDEDAILYLWSSTEDVPDWAHLFLGRIEEPENFPRKKTVSAILFCLFNQAVFAICFGNGHARLNDDAAIADFGFRIALGSIGDKLRSIQKRQVDTSAKKTTQSSRHSLPIHGFEFDTWLDLLKGAQGVPENPNFASQIGGQDSLHLTFKGGLDRLPGKLLLALDYYKKNDFREKFTFLNNIRPVREKRLIKTLRRYLLDGLNYYRLGLQSTLELQLDTPSNLEHGDYIAGYRFSRGRDRNSYDINAPSFDSLFDLLGRDTEILPTDLQQVQLNACSDDGTIIARRSLEKCLHFEIKEDGKNYILLEGLWYRYNPEFLSGIEERIASIPIWGNLPAQAAAYSTENEDTYILQLIHGLSMPGHSAARLHKRLIQPPGETSIEACDIITSEFEMIHVKRGSSSEDLAHMLNQALVSAALLKKHEQFVPLLREKLAGEAAILRTLDQLPFTLPTIVFLVLNGPAQAPDWPLFSRIRLAHAARDLEAYGYKVAIAHSTPKAYKRVRKIRRQK